MWPFRRQSRLAAPPIDPFQGDAGAAALVASLERRDWRSAQDFLRSVRDPDDFAFYIDMCGDVQGLQGWIEEWIRAEPHSTLPLLVRGSHAIDWAWQARGSGRADTVSEAQFRLFFQRLKLAEDCLDEVTERDRNDPTPWGLLITTAMGRQLGTEAAWRRFNEAVARYPLHRQAHNSMLSLLCRKWGGSHEQMHEFADKASAGAPPGSRLHALVVSAHLERWLDLPTGEDLAYLRQPEVGAALNAAADRSVRNPAFRRGPGWPGIHNEFAMAFWLGDYYDAAAEQFDAIGDLVTKWPWQYLSGSEAAQRFAIARDASYKKRKR